MIPKTTTPEHTALIILDAIRTHEQKVGIERLSLILKGSKNKRVIEDGLDSSPIYGALFYYPLDVIENFIKQLINEQYCEIIDIGSNFSIPTLRLALKGKDAVTNKQDVHLKEVHLPPELTETLKGTIDLFLEKQSIQAVAKERNLVETTIWKHLIDAVRIGILKPSDILSEERIKQVRDVQARLRTNKATPIKEALPDLSYEEIRCVLANERKY